MTTYISSAVTIVRSVANSAISIASTASTSASSAAADASTAISYATFASQRVTSIYTDLNTTYDTQPSASVMTNSKNSPILASLTQNQTWGYALTDLTGATPPFTYQQGVYSDVLKVINLSQLYNLTLNLQNSANDQYQYVVQPGESICAYYTPQTGVGSGAWIFSASVL